MTIDPGLFPPGIPIGEVQPIDTAEIAAGTLLFSPYRWYNAEPLQWGIKIGTDRDVLALTDWHDGHSKAGSIVRPRDDYPVFAIGTGKELKVTLQLDQNASLVDAPETHRGALGFLGFGRAGASLLSRAPDPNWAGSCIAYPINPHAWERETPAQGQGPEAWTTDWSVVLSLSSQHQVALAVTRT